MTSVAYHNNIPAAGNDPSADQPLMLTNTNSIPILLGIDHVGFGNNESLGGYHKIVHFFLQNADPAKIQYTGQLYTKTVSGDQQLFYETGLGTISQLTNLATVAASTGYITLPGGIILKWGNFIPTSNDFNVSFSPVFPTNCFNLQLSVSGSNSSNYVSKFKALNKDKFTYTGEYSNSNPSNSVLYYFAVGN
jgi:hypothetical protein